MLHLLLLLLPIASLSGWFIGRKTQHLSMDFSKQIPADYFLGLNYIINEQPDRALDVFLKLVEVDSETVETHLALGSLFRRRGEVDRATRVHQNIIARPSLEPKQKIQAMIELGKDYLKAGVLDRAERIFLELVQLGVETRSSLRHLLHIYEQQKDWQQAMRTANKIEAVTSENMQATIAHYYCEMAEVELAKNALDQAKRYLRRAHAVDKTSARVSILQAKIAMIEADYKTAIGHLQSVAKQDFDYVAETVSMLYDCYHALHEDERLYNYLQGVMQKQPRLSIVLMLAKLVQHQYGDQAAVEFISENIQHNPSLHGFERLIQLYLASAEGDAHERLELLESVVRQLMSEHATHRCTECGFAAKNLYWHCPGCHGWSTVRPIPEMTQVVA